MKQKILIGTMMGLLALGATMGVALAQSATDTPAALPTTAITDTVAGTSTILTLVKHAETDSDAVTSTPKTGPDKAQDEAFIQKLSVILGIDPAKVKDAVEQARQQVGHDQVDSTIQARLDKLVAAGKITQAEADQIFAWVQSRPAAVDKLTGGGILGQLHGNEGLHLGQVKGNQGLHLGQGDQGANGDNGKQGGHADHGNNGKHGGKGRD